MKVKQSPDGDDYRLCLLLPTQKFNADVICKGRKRKKKNKQQK
jgi:hypothetical protein